MGSALESRKAVTVVRKRPGEELQDPARAEGREGRCVDGGEELLDLREHWIGDHLLRARSAWRDRQVLEDHDPLITDLERENPLWSCARRWRTLDTS